MTYPCKSVQVLRKSQEYHRRTCLGLHREIVPPRETVAIARVAIAIVGRCG